MAEIVVRRASVDTDLSVEFIVMVMSGWNAQYGEAIAILPFAALIVYMILATRPGKTR